MDFRICILFVTFVLSYSEQCNVYPDISNCRYEMFCENLVDSNFDLGYYRRHSEYYARPSYYDAPEPPTACQEYVSYSGYDYKLLYLKYKETSRDLIDSHAVPVVQRYSGAGTQLLEIVYSLDLSRNNYETSPDIRSMGNLALLDLSRNLLTTAVLSNSNQLSKLKEIDLSINKINYIVVRSYQYAYSSLKKINLAHNELAKIPDAVFDSISNLETLDLSYNYIEELTPFTFEGTRSLQVLNLSNNRLSDINSSLFRFTDLTWLNLSGNRIKELKSIDFEKLNNLALLDVSANYIKTIDFTMFEKMVSLSSLDFSNNSLEALSKDSFANLKSLTSINLSTNKLKSLPKDLFKNATIYDFSVSDNLLEGPLIKGIFAGINVTELDLSSQLLTSIEDNAFNDLTRLQTLLLNNNGIESLSNMCFTNLISLEMLDLSNNKISSIDFNKTDLINLKSLILKSNRLAQIKHEYFEYLDNLEYLDLSDNAITRLEPGSFKSLRILLNLRISNNPLSGALETDTFSGLVSLPSVDISNSLLTTVQNASFTGMHELKELNMSCSKIKELQFNVFIQTGYIETLDLSYNELEEFFLNMTELGSLNTLFLNNNHIKTVSTLQELSQLIKINLAFNYIENVEKDSFNNLNELQVLDLSYNVKLNVSHNLLDKKKSLSFLNLSGVKTNIHFGNVENTTISHVTVSDAGIHNITALNLTGFTELTYLELSNNSVSKLEIGAFTGLRILTKLDLSYNKISFIQPGVFKYNELLTSLNISHNLLTVVSYGIFRGLNYLNTLDMSYNNIKDLQSERFYEVRNLMYLIVDHNQIDTLNVEEFAGSHLEKLSIGDNPLPCRILVQQKNRASFNITAIKIDEHSTENIDGISCNKDKGDKYIVVPTATTDDFNSKNDVLIDIRNILNNMNHMSKNTAQENNNKYLENLSNAIVNSNTADNEKLTNLANLTSKVIDMNNSTNVLLKKILHSLEDNAIATTALMRPTNGTNTLVNDSKTVDLIMYMNKIKKELEQTIAVEKQIILSEFEHKLSVKNETTQLPTSEKLATNIEGTKSVFTETCVALILVVLVCVVLYKFYESRMFVRKRRSLSTHELPSAMDNSTL